MKAFLTLTFIISFICTNIFGQDFIKGVILSVEDDKVYFDLTENDISVGDRLKIIMDRGFFIHPVTGEQIVREPEIVAYVEITVVRSNYSEGIVSPRSAILSIDAGMEAVLLDDMELKTREFRKSIAVLPLDVPSTRGGYIGVYSSVLLTEELFNIDKLRVIDRQSLGWQIEELALANQGVVDEREAIRIGRTQGVDYFITGTFFDPDVVDLSTGIPLKGIVTTAEAISGRRLGSGLVSDVRVSQLRAIVNISLRVVDVETGEILFIASEMQQVTGKSEVNLEQGVLGGMQIQGGSTSFLNTITGQATRAALKNLVGYIENYFDGNITERNFRGNYIGSSGVEMSNEIRNVEAIDRESLGWEKAKIIFVNYIEPTKRSISQQFQVTIDRGENAKYRKRAYGVYEKIGNEYKRIGQLNLEAVDYDKAHGIITIYQNHLPKDYSFSNAIISRRRPK